MDDLILQKLKGDPSPVSKSFIAAVFGGLPTLIKAAIERRVDVVRERVDKHAETIAGLEHRADSHARHLQALEARLKKLEGK